MSRQGDFWENRVTGERAVVLRGTEDGGGEPMLVELTVRPGGAVAGEHVHPALTERFEVVSGTLSTRIAGVEGQLREGESATVALGVKHDWWNAGTDVAKVLVTIDPPAPRFEMMIATLWGLASDGKTSAKGMPNPFQLALIGSEFSDIIRFTKPPPAVQKVAFAALGAVGRLRGYKGIYPEYLGPDGTVAAETAPTPK